MSYDYKCYVYVPSVCLSKIYGLPMIWIFCVDVCTVQHTVCLTETKQFDATAITRSVSLCLFLNVGVNIVQGCA